MAADWFYREESQVVGPMSAKELKWLASQGSIKGGTMVRRGPSGDWFAAERLADVLGLDSVPEVVEVRELLPDEWHFMRDGRKLGPVSFSVLGGLAESGRLNPDDLIWSPDTADWRPAEQFGGLFEPPPLANETSPTLATEAPPADSGARPTALRTRLAWRTAATLLIAAAAVVALRGRASQPERADADAKTASSEEDFIIPPVVEAIEKRTEIDERIVEPTVPTQPPPSPLAPEMTGGTIPDAPRRAPGAARPGLGIAANPPPLPVTERPRRDVAAEDRSAVADVVVAKPPARAATIDAFLDAPDAFLGVSIVLDGVFKVGTRIFESMDKQGFELESSIPIARDDDRTISTLEGKVYGRDLRMILDPRVAGNLHRMFDLLKITPTVKPSYKAILGVRVQPTPIEAEGKSTVIVVDSLEILAGCDYYLAASRNYSRAFQVAFIDVDGGRTDYGDGDEWVRRLGGDEKFVAPIRRKLRDLRRRIVNDASGAVVDPALRRQLDAWGRRATAINAINALRAGRFTTEDR